MYGKYLARIFIRLEDAHYETVNIHYLIFVWIDHDTRLSRIICRDVMKGFTYNIYALGSILIFIFLCGRSLNIPGIVRYPSRITTASP